MAISLIKDMDKETVLRVLLTMLENAYHSQKRGGGHSAGLFLGFAHDTILLSPVCPIHVKNIINRAYIAMNARRYDETSKYISLAYHLVLRLDNGRAPLPIDDYDLREGGVYFPGDEKVNENKFQSTLDSILKEADYMDNNNPNNNSIDQGTITPPDMNAQTQEVPDEKNPEDKPADEEEPEEDEETKEEPEEKSEVRLLIIDKIPCNKELKELTKDPMAEFPLTAVEAALDKINIAIEPEEKEGFHLDGETGNIDLELTEKSSGKYINNSFLIIYWEKIDGGKYNLNCYLG